MTGSKIEKIEIYLPEKILTNKDLMVEFPEWDASKIEKKVGIRNRHVVADKETAFDLAIEVGKKVLQKFDKEKIDFVLYCTQSPTFFLPSTACILQDVLGLRRDIGALDFNLGCSGFVYGLSIADSLIKAGRASSILLIVSETYSKHLHPLDKGNKSIFGDGAAATIVSTSDKNNIGEFVFGTDGSGFNKLIVKEGAFKSESKYLKYEVSQFDDKYLYMNGPDIFNFTMEVVPKLVNDSLIKNNKSFDEIDFFIFHQANKYILEFLRKKIKIPKDKFYIDLEETGNTVSATIPIAISQCLTKGLIKEGNTVMLIGFGVGLSWASCIIEI